MNEKKHFVSIRQAFIGSALVLISAGFFFFKYWYDYTQVPARVGSRLNAIAKTKSDEIVAFIENQKQQMDALIQNNDFKSLALRLLSDAADYKKDEAALDQFLSAYANTYAFKDLFLIRPDGTIYYANKGEVGANLHDPAFKKNALSVSFKRVVKTLKTDISEFSVNDLTKTPALFIVKPLLKQEELQAVIAIQVDDNELYKIIQNYEQLPYKTSDIIVAKNIGDRALFIAPSRFYANIAFKKITNIDKDNDTPIRKASLGNQGFGKARDALGNIPVIAAWRFIPELQWGLVVNVSYNEAYASLKKELAVSIILLILALLCLLYAVYRARDTVAFKRARSFAFSKQMAHIVIWVGFICSVTITGFLFWKRHITYQRIFNQTKQSAATQIEEKAKYITQEIDLVEKTAKQIAQDLRAGSLEKSAIANYLAQNLKRLPNLKSIAVAYAPFAFDPQKRLYGIQAERNGADIQTSQITQDYMLPGDAQDPSSDWYNKTIRQGAFWTAPYFDKQSRQTYVRYCVPFYNNGTQDPHGVITIVLNLAAILAGMREIEIGKTGYAMLVLQNGTLIYHPVEQYVVKKTTLFDIAKKDNNEMLKEIANHIAKGQSGFETYKDPITHEQFWVTYAPIRLLHWSVVGLFSEESLNIPVEMFYTLRIWIFICITIALLLLSMLVTRLWECTGAHLRRWAIAGSIVFAVMLIIFWIVTLKTPYQLQSDVVIVRDQAGLDQYTEYLDLEAAARDEKRPIVVPTGIILHTVSFPDANTITVSGYVWQKFKRGSENSKQGIRLPEASESHLKEIVRKEKTDYEIVGWDMRASFTQRHRYSWFPFDKVHIDIVLASADFENNVVIVPDFNSYQSLDIDPTPGISEKLAVPGFDLERSFFSFINLPSYDEVGLETLNKVTEKVQLHYNVILKRKLTNPLIIFFLPLLVILFSIYAILLISFRNSVSADIFKSLGAYTAIFFSLIILHQTLRSQYQAGELLYFEYFFFFTYITILLLILHAVVLRISHFTNFVRQHISPYLRVFFWFIQCLAWFIITMIIFYGIR